MGKMRGPKWDSDFERWKKILLSWLRLQEKEKSNSEIVAAIILGLSESTRLKNGESVVDVILELEDSELYPEDDNSEVLFQLKDTARPIKGLSNIINTLQTKYGEREDIKMFKFYEEFESLVKNKNETMKDFIIKFETLYKKLERSGMKLPDLMLAYRLMKSANLGKDEIFAKVGVGAETMTFSKMKNTLLNISDCIVQTSSHMTVSPKIKLIKEEPTEILYQDHEPCGEYDADAEGYENNQDSYEDDEEIDETYYQFQNRPNRRNNFYGYRGRGNNFRYNRGGRGGNFQRPSPSNVNNKSKLNRQDPSGKITSCTICCSIFHWAPECPHKNDSHLYKTNNKPETILKLDCLFMTMKRICVTSPHSRKTLH